MKSVLALAAAAAASSGAGLVDIRWDAEGRFAHQLQLAPGKLAEACGTLPAAARVAWQYTADAPLDFNIHYHEGKAVQYPARLARQARAEGELATTSAQDYCWMWTNTGTAPVTLQLSLQRR